MSVPQNDQKFRPLRDAPGLHRMNDVPARASQFDNHRFKESRCTASLKGLHVVLIVPEYLMEHQDNAPAIGIRTPKSGHSCPNAGEECEQRCRHALSPRSIIQPSIATIKMCPVGARGIVDWTYPGTPSVSAGPSTAT